MGIVKDEVTIFSIDAVAMYPSITYRSVEDAVNYFARKANLKTQDLQTIKHCLEMIKLVCPIN